MFTVPKGFFHTLKGDYLRISKKKIIAKLRPKKDDEPPEKNRNIWFCSQKQR